MANLRYLINGKPLLASRHCQEVASQSGQEPGKIAIPYALLRRIGPVLKKGAENRVVRKETEGLFRNTTELKEDIEHAKLQARRSRILY